MVGDNKILERVRTEAYVTLLQGVLPDVASDLKASIRILMTGACKAESAATPRSNTPKS
jgi:hypothetical protein